MDLYLLCISEVFKSDAVLILQDTTTRETGKRYKDSFHVFLQLQMNLYLKIKKQLKGNCPILSPEMTGIGNSFLPQRQRLVCQAHFFVVPKNKWHEGGRSPRSGSESRCCSFQNFLFSSSSTLMHGDKIAETPKSERPAFLIRLQVMLLV